VSPWEVLGGGCVRVQLKFRRQAPLLQLLFCVLELDADGVPVAVRNCIESSLLELDGAPGSLTTPQPPWCTRRSSVGFRHLDVCPSTA